MTYAIVLQLSSKIEWYQRKAHRAKDVELELFWIDVYKTLWNDYHKQSKV